MDFKPNWLSRLAKLLKAYIIIHMANCILCDPMMMLSVSHVTFSLAFPHLSILCYAQASYRERISCSQFQLLMHVLRQKSPYCVNQMACLRPFLICIAFLSVSQDLTWVCSTVMMNVWYILRLCTWDKWLQRLLWAIYWSPNSSFKAWLVVQRETVELDFAGYRFDEHDRDSFNLRLQFARYPGARSGGGHRGKRWIVRSGRWFMLSFLSTRPLIIHGR